MSTTPTLAIIGASLAGAKAAEAARNSNVGISAQDLYWEREGAFTGEVSGAMLREAGADYVIIGHSERRTLFGETDASVNRKLLAAFAMGCDPLGPVDPVEEPVEHHDKDRDGHQADHRLEFFTVGGERFNHGAGAKNQTQHRQPVHGFRIPKLVIVVQ